MSAPPTPPTCRHCGGPLTVSRAHINYGGGRGEWVSLRTYCPSRECQEERDAAALKEMIDRRVIDP